MSVILIVCTMTIYHQLLFVKNRPVGYSRDGLIMVRKKSDEFNTEADVLRVALKKAGVVSEIAEVGGSSMATWSHNIGFNWEGKDPSFDASFATRNVSPEFGKTVGWKVVEGRDFSPDIVSDSSVVILNEAAVKYMKLNDPVGKTIRGTNRAWNVDQDFLIVGVTRDIIMNSPFEPVKPAIYITYGYERVLLMRIAPGVSPSDALPEIEKIFAAIIPDIPFDYAFADQALPLNFPRKSVLENWPLYLHRWQSSSVAWVFSAWLPLLQNNVPKRLGSEKYCCFGCKLMAFAFTGISRIGSTFPHHRAAVGILHS